MKTLTRLFPRYLLLAVAALASGLLAWSCKPETPGKVRVGLLPIIDSLPFFVAEKEGLFTNENLQVEMVVFASALERDSALQAGQVDAQLADLVASGLLNRDRERIKIVDSTYRATPSKAQIYLVAGPKTAIQGPADLKGKKIGISENSLIDYVTDRLLESAGMKPADVNKVSVPRIPERMTLLSSGGLDAATLPEPFATLALQAGGRVILDDGKAEIGVSVLEFRSEFLKDNQDVARRFVQAHQKAIALLNGNRPKYQPLLAEKASLPDSIKTTFPTPPFPENHIPSRQDIQAAVDWMVSKGLLSQKLSYEQLVDPGLLKK